MPGAVDNSFLSDYLLQTELMKAQKPLPIQLHGRSFSLSEARLLGLNRADLRRRELLIASRGIRVPWDVTQDLSAILAPLLQMAPCAIVSHSTAAKLWDLPLPARLSADRQLDLARVCDSTNIVRFGVRGHRLKLVPAEIAEVQGLNATSPARTWLDLASLLAVDELVAAGDAIICSHQRSFGPKKIAIAEISELRQMILTHKGQRGLNKAKQALALIRVGADSAPESYLRLAGLALGLPEPDLNVIITNDRGDEIAWPDLAYRKYRISIQYDGRHHLTPTQLAHDARRDNETARAGWLTVRINREMINDLGYLGAMKYVSRFLIQSGWTSTRTP